jgi:hypothetical protein
LLSSTFLFSCNMVTNAHLVCNRWPLPRRFISRDMIQSSELKILQLLHGSDVPAFASLTQTLACRCISTVYNTIQTPNTLCPRDNFTIPQAATTISRHRRFLSYNIQFLSCFAKDYVCLHTPPIFNLCIWENGSRDSAVGIATGYGSDD